MPEIQRKTVVRKITDSMVAAQKDYAESSLDFICDAPEYLLTVYIYQALYKARSEKYLTFEESPIDIDYCLGRTRRGRKSRELRSHGRCDLLLWSSRARPRAIIEVKRNTKNIEADIRRLAAMLLGDRRLSFGVLACYICQRVGNKREAQAKKELKTTLKNVLAKAQSTSEGRVRFKLLNHNIIRADVSDGRWLWRPVCFLFTPIRVNK